MSGGEDAEHKNENGIKNKRKNKNKIESPKKHKNKTKIHRNGVGNENTEQVCILQPQAKPYSHATPLNPLSDKAKSMLTFRLRRRSSSSSSCSPLSSSIIICVNVIFPLVVITPMIFVIDEDDRYGDFIDVVAIFIDGVAVFVGVLDDHLFGINLCRRFDSFVTESRHWQPWRVLCISVPGSAIRFLKFSL